MYRVAHYLDGYGGVNWMPSDPALLWFRDFTRLPQAIAPLDETLAVPAFAAGVTSALSQLPSPIEDLRAEVLNGHIYLAAKPIAGGLASWEALREKSRDYSDQAAWTLLSDWRSLYRPRVEVLCGELLEFRYQESTAGAAARQIADWVSSLEYAWTVHTLVAIGSVHAEIVLEGFIAEQLGRDKAIDARRLLIPPARTSVSLESGLDDLVSWVRHDDSLISVVLATPVIDGHLAPVTHGLRGEFMERWRAFLSAHGWRSDRLLEISAPSWQESETTPVSLLKTRLRAASEPETGTSVAEMRAQVLSALPPAHHAELFRLLAIADAVPTVLDEHNTLLDHLPTMALRHATMALGVRLVTDGILSAASDIFFLTAHEIRALAEGWAGGGLNDLISVRIRARERNDDLAPPGVLGLRPTTPQPSWARSWFNVLLPKCD